MPHIFKTTLLAVSGGAALCAAAFAQDIDSFSGADALEISDFIGTVTVRTGKTFSIAKADGTDASYTVHIKQDGDVVRVYSDEDPEDLHWSRKVNWRRDHDKAFVNFLKGYPTLTVTLPRGSALAFDDAVVMLSAGDTEGAFSAHGGYVEGEIGDVASGDIGIHSSADLKVGEVAGTLSIAIHGSGDVHAGRAGELDARIHGSGDIKTADISGGAGVSIHGSGDVSLGEIDGPASFSIHGSGDIRAANVHGGAELDTYGSGDIALDSVDGETSVSSRGSGDVRIASGRASNLKVRIAGSGDFSMGGVAINPDVESEGSGDIRIARHEGPIIARGRGDIRISGERYGDDD